MLHLCTLVVGLVQTCSATAFSGSTPIERGDRVYDCKVVLGLVTSCSLPYTGTVVLSRQDKGGKHVSCTINHGFITLCSATGFSGSAVVYYP